MFPLGLTRVCSHSPSNIADNGPRGLHRVFKRRFFIRGGTVAQILVLEDFTHGSIRMKHGAAPNGHRDQ